MSTQPKNPADLLERQVEVMTSLYHLQAKAQEQLDQLHAEQKVQSERLADIAEAVRASAGQTYRAPNQVKLIDASMPLMSLVWLILKASIAAIPAYIMWLVILLLFSQVFSRLLFGGLFR